MWKNTYVKHLCEEHLCETLKWKNAYVKALNAYAKALMWNHLCESTYAKALNAYAKALNLCEKNT